MLKKLYNLNTSYVKVKRNLKIYKIINIFNLNTSYVKVKRLGGAFYGFFKGI